MYRLLFVKTEEWLAYFTVIILSLTISVILVIVNTCICVSPFYKVKVEFQPNYNLHRTRLNVKWTRVGLKV